MNKEAFKEVIKRRVYAEEISCGEWDEEIEKCWKIETDILSEDIPGTIEYLQNECTDDEYSWISEVLQEVVLKTMSSELVECYKSLMAKFPEECETYNIGGVVEIAEGILRWEAEHGKKD